MFGEAWSMNLTEMTEKKAPPPDRVVRPGDRCSYCFEDDTSRLTRISDKTVICSSCAREKYRDE